MGIREKGINMDIGEFDKIVVETDEKNSTPIVTIDKENVIVNQGYRVRLVPKEKD